MSFEGRTTDELVRIAVAGGGLRLDAAGRSTDDLVRIAVAGSTKGLRLVFAGLTGRSTDELVSIAVAGKGCVVFEG